MKLTHLLAALITSSLISLPSWATIVRLDTSLGTIDVNLYDQGTPETVANFLSYVSAGDYDGSIIHRSVDGFIIQGGGFGFDGTLPLNQISSGASVDNEPEYSNVRGTIAMAKLAGNPNSATNQWFFNLGNNSANLDVQNGGFTVFGEVMTDDMDIVDAIANVATFNKGGALTDLPLRNYSAQDDIDDVDPTGNNFVVINSVTVIDSSTTTASGSNPTPNTRIDSGNNGGGSSNDSGGGGGGPFSPMLLAFAIAALLLRKRI